MTTFDSEQWKKKLSREQQLLRRVFEFMKSLEGLGLDKFDSIEWYKKMEHDDLSMIIHVEGWPLNRFWTEHHHLLLTIYF